ncbi:MAG TPA: T9SS type A sorting domain-containing protein [bacterium (Candidatus Stahlbacteria)]|nr:T9SS type A sorting domain-containing protein [Candidatus Stahlbacteria bacterium]
MRYLLVFIFLLPGVIVAAPPWITNVPVSDDPAGSNQDEVCIAVWQNYVFAYFNDYRVPSVHAFFARSTDGGLSWEPNYQMPQDSVSGYMGDPSVAVDDTGYLFLACCDFARNRVYLTRSTDLGTTWEPTKYVSPGISAIDKDWVSTKGRNVYVVWDLGPQAVRHIYLTKSTDRGETFGPVVIVDNATTGNARWGPIPRELDDGTVLVSWGCDTRSGIDTANGIYCARSTDGGSTFTEYLITNTRFRYNSSNPRLFVLPPLETSPTYPQDVYTAFNDGPAQYSSDRRNLNVYFSGSTDGGITWSTRIKINDDSTSSADTMQQFMPWMATDYRGWLHVVWYDGRRHQPSSNRYDLFYSYSTDRGLTWSPNERVTDTSFVMNAFCGDYIGVDTDSQYVYASWCDTRNSPTQPDIYFSRRPLPGVEVAEQTEQTISPIRVYPNPMSSRTVIHLTQNPKLKTEIKIFNVTGQLIRSFAINGQQGPIRIVWDGRNQNEKKVPSGIYFCEVIQGAKASRQKIVLID